MSLRHGRPSIFHDEDIGVELPNKESEIRNNPSNRLGPYTFYYMSTLALLESRVYSALYSVRSRTQSKLRRLQTVGDLDHELQTWLETVPVAIRPGQEILCHERDVSVVILPHFHVLQLRNDHSSRVRLSRVMDERRGSPNSQKCP